MKKILISLFTIAIVGALITGGVMAIFTDTETSGQNTFGTGTVDLGLTGGNPLSFTVSGMAPGDSATGTITVANNGTLDLRYAMTTTVGGANPGLAGQLVVWIWGVGLGDQTYGPGPLNAAASGNPAQGQDLGDRFLASGTSETLTFLVGLPPTTSNNWQGKSCDVTFVFHAEQTANNP